MTQTTTSIPHGLKAGDIIQTEPPSFWRVLIGSHRITFVSQAMTHSFIVGQRRMTWHEWWRLLWASARGEKS